MDVREKTVELVKRAIIDWEHGDASEWIADHLISNGVTVQENVEISDELLNQLKNAPITTWKEEPSIEMVQEWISVEDRLPEKHDRFICTYKFNSNSEMQFVGVLDYYASDQHPHWQHESAGVIVTHWMPLPKPPKGE